MFQVTGYPAEIADFNSAISAGYWGVFLVAKIVRLVGIQLTLTLKMITAQVVETSVTVNNNSPIQDYVHPDDEAQPTFEMTLGFKPFTKPIELKNKTKNIDVWRLLFILKHTIKIICIKLKNTHDAYVSLKRCTFTFLGHWRAYMAC